MKEGVLGYIFKHQERLDILSGKKPFNAESYSILISPTNEEGQEIPVIMFSPEQLADHDKRVAQEAFQSARKTYDMGGPFEDYAIKDFDHYWSEQQARKGEAE